MSLKDLFNKKKIILPDSPPVETKVEGEEYSTPGKYLRAKTTYRRFCGNCKSEKLQMRVVRISGGGKMDIWVCHSCGSVSGAGLK